MAWAILDLLAVAMVAGFAARFVVQSAPGRAFVERRLEGLSVGRLGRLHVEGLRGDVGSDFAVSRLTIADNNGVWLEADDVAVSWSPIELLFRRAHVTAVVAGLVRVERTPILSPAGPPGQPPVGLAIDRFAALIETLPAASVQRGLFAVTGALDAQRNGALRGDINAQSRVHQGDGLVARFDFGVKQRVAIDAVAREASGGAIAGLLGLPARQLFTLDAHAGGEDGRGGLHLLARSGADVIAQADGGWTPAGGNAVGRVTLAASRWTAPLVKALGPELRFAAARHAAADGLDGVALFARSDNASLEAAGVADTFRLVAKGLNVDAQIADMRRVAPTPAMGRASLSGKVTGGWDDAHLVGEASLTAFSFGGYDLARIAGPIDLARTKGDWRLQASLSGAGGAGAGLANLIGARPQASLDATRLADGRTLIRFLKATGAGVSLDATGEQGLFGDLSLKGDARLADLQAVRPGAHGAIDASWSASEGRGATAWRFAVNGQGRGVTSGIELLDHMLGASPSLTGQGAFDHGAVTIDAASLVGAAASAHSAGIVGSDGAMKLSIGWATRGPLDVGPLEITGQAKGAGALTGTFATPRLDLTSDFDEISAPDLTLKPAHVVLSFYNAPGGARATLALNASSDYGPAHARADLRFMPSGIAFSGIDAAGAGVVARGALTLTRASPSQADLTLAIGPGAVLTQGHADARLVIVDAAGGPNLDLALKAAGAEMRGVPLVGDSVVLTAKGPVSEAPYKLAGDLGWAGTPFHVQGDGVLRELDPGYAATFEGAGHVRKTAFRTLSPATFSFGGANTAVEAALALGSGRIDVDAHEGNRQFTATAKLSGVAIAAIDADYAGSVDAGLNLSGHDNVLSGDLTAHLSGARVSDAPTTMGMDGDLKAVLSSQRIDVTATGLDAAGGRANVTLALPAVATAAPFRIAVAETQPMSGAFDLNGEVEPVWALLFGGERSLGGQVDARGAIAGTLNDPQLTGHATLVGGRFEDAATGLKLRDVAAVADLEGARVDLRSFDGADLKSGRISGQGTVDLAKGGSSNLTLMLKGFQLLDNETASAVASGPLILSRDAGGRAKLTGQLVIDRSDIAAQMSRSPPGVVRMEVIERNRPVSLDEGSNAPASHPPLAVGLDIALRSASGVIVRGLGLNAQMSLDAHVGADTANPLLTGVARVVRGDYQFAGQRFEIDSRSVVTLASAPQDIRLNLTATRNDPSLTAVISITGTATKPVIVLSSTPSLPKDEILAQVLFGSSAAQLSPVEAAELAAAVTTLATGGGFDVMGGLQNFAKLDRLALGGDSASGVTVSGGKYIGKNVYLELTGGGRAGPSAQVAVSAGHGLSIISQVGGQEGEKLAIRWRRDYGGAATGR